MSLDEAIAYRLNKIKLVLHLGTLNLLLTNVNCSGKPIAIPLCYAYDVMLAGQKWEIESPQWYHRLMTRVAVQT